MPKTKDGGWLLDDSPMFTPEQIKEIDRLMRAGHKAEADALVKKIIKARMEYEQSTIDHPTKRKGKK